jgi:hypothetical protein
MQEPEWIEISNNEFMESANSQTNYIRVIWSGVFLGDVRARKRMENHLSDKSKEHLQYDIIDYIIREYQIDISNIKVYTQAVFSAALESGTPFPKSSIIKPEIVGDSDEMPITLVNDRPEAQSNPDIRERVDSFLDLKDNTLQKLGFEVISESGYIEAGNIVIVVETK